VQFGALSQKELELLSNVVERLVKFSDRAVALQNYRTERRQDDMSEFKSVDSRRLKSK
jgi:hypothetical protein